MAKDDLTFRQVQGSELTIDQIDANFDRLMYYSSDWSAGTYQKNEVVRHNGKLWAVKNTIASTTQEPVQSAAGVVTKWGYNFRDTVGFVTDQTDYTFVPRTQLWQGDDTFGWGIAAGAADRNASLDPSIAGFQFKSPGDTDAWYLRLPEGPGTYKIRFAAYDDSTTNYCYWAIRDGNFGNPIRHTIGSQTTNDDAGVITVNTTFESPTGWSIDNQTPFEIDFLTDVLCLTAETPSDGNKIISALELSKETAAVDSDWELIGYVPDPNPMVWKNPWQAGTYVQGDVVTHETMLWVVEKESTTQEPDLDAVVGETSDWNILARSPTALAEMGMDVPTADADITAAWSDLDMFTSEQWAPINIETNVGLGQFKFLTAGIYEVVLFANLSHDSANKGRTFRFRVNNVTDGVGAAGVPVGVARDQLVSSIAITFPVVVTDADATDADWFNFQVGDTSDTISLVVWNALQFHIKRIA